MGMFNRDLKPLDGRAALQLPHRKWLIVKFLMLRPCVRSSLNMRTHHIGSCCWAVCYLLSLGCLASPSTPLELPNTPVGTMAQAWLRLCQVPNLERLTHGLAQMSKASTTTQRSTLQTKI
jgi:hypothetical protein